MADSVEIKYHGKNYTVDIGRENSQLFHDFHGEIKMPMDHTYRLDTAIRMLIGVIKQNG